MRFWLTFLITAAFFIPLAVPFAHAQVIYPNRGGLGTTTSPAYGQIPVGNAGGTYTLTSTSSLGISGGGGSGNQFPTSTNPLMATFFVATGTPTSTLPSLSITSALSLLGDYISNVTTWIRGKIDAYLTGGTGVSYSAGNIAIDFSEFDTGSVTEGSNKYYTDARVGSYISGSSTVPHIGGTAYGDVLYWNGSAWSRTATSGLAVAISDTTGTLLPPRGGTGSTSLSGLLKGNGTGAVQTAVPGTDYENPLTFSNPLSRLVNAISCLAASGSQAGCLSSADWTTFNSKQATISTTWPITLSGATIGFNGLSTSTAAVVGNIPYFSGVNTFANTSTTSLTASSPLSLCQPISVIGASPSALTCATASGSQAGCLASADFSAFNSRISTSTLNALRDWNVIGGNSYLSPTTTLGIVVNASSTITNFSSINSTSTNATTTSLGVQNLTAANCDVKATTNGAIYCGTDLVGGGAGSSPFSTTTSTHAGRLIVYPNNSATDILAIGSNATTSAEFYFDPNIPSAYLSGSTTLQNATSSRFYTPLLGVGTDYLTDLTGTGLQNTGGALTLDVTGDWTGTVDGNNFAGGAIGSGDLLYGSGAGAISELGIGTAGSVLSISNGLPVWTSTSTLLTESEFTNNKDFNVVGGTSYLAPTSTLGVIINASSTFNGLLTTKFSSTTAQTVSGTASTSKFFADGLTNCNSENMLTWSAGTFGCESDTAGAGGSGSNWSVVGGTSYLTPSSTIGIILNASSTFNGNLNLGGSNATATIANAMQFGSTAGSNKLLITADKVFPASNSTGGMVNLTNTSNTGPALVVYTNNGGTSSGNLVNIRCDNTAMTHDCFKIDHDGAGDGLAIAATASASNALSLSNTGVDHTLNASYTGSTVNKGAANFTSTNALGSTVQITGVEDALGALKVTQTSTANSPNSAVLSLQQNGTAGQGIFLDTASSFTGKLLTIRAGGVELITATSTGYLGLATTTPAERLSVHGNIFTNGNITAANITATGTLNVSGNTTLANATSTNFAVTALNAASCDVKSNNGSLYCGIDSTTAGTNPFTWASTYGALNAATSSNLWAQGILNASSTVTFGSATKSPFRWDSVNGRLGIGTLSPSEILHVSVPSGSFGTFQLDSGATQAYLWAYDGDNSVNMGSKSNSVLNIKVNNSTKATFATNGNFGIGTTSPFQPLSVGGNLTLDQYSTYQLNGSTVLSASSTTFNTLVGIGAGANLLATSTDTTSGVRNIAIGYQAMQNATSSDSSIAIGYQALRSTYPSSLGGGLYGFNDALGYAAGQNITTGQYNNLFGYTAGQSLTTGSENTVMGDAAATDGNFGNSVFIGAGGTGAVTNGSTNNIAIGFQTANQLSSGSHNTIFGKTAAFNLTTGSYNIIIGQNSDATSSGMYRGLNIGNVLYGSGLFNGAAPSSVPTSDGRIGIATSAPAVRLDVFNTSTSTIRADTNSTTVGGCIILKDVTGTGYTKVFAKAGVLTASVATSPTTCQ